MFKALDSTFWYGLGTRRCARPLKSKCGRSEGDGSLRDKPDVPATGESAYCSVGVWDTGFTGQQVFKL